MGGDGGKDKPVGDEVKSTTCYMCACRCGIDVHLKDGKVRYIQGNPKHPVNQGVLCAKGSAGIMQHNSPARLHKPLLRVGERGAREFREIEWDEAMALATQWLGDIRARDPDQLAFYTGRDQSQALTGWWAQQFGTINYAAHGGFCSVNMAAAGMYSFGGSFWEFGEPDWEHTRYLMMWGVAEDHDSNPIKLGLGKLKARGAKIVVVNPVRSGYGAVADEWIGIRPGTDGLFAMALIHELLRCDRIDLDYLVRHTNAHWLVIRDPGAADDGLIARDSDGNPLCFDRGIPDSPLSPGEGPGVRVRISPAGASPAATDFAHVADPHPNRSPGGRGAQNGRLANALSGDVRPAVVGEYALADGRSGVPAFQLVAERYLDPQYAPEAVAKRCGIDADTIRRIAAELAHAAFEQSFVLPQPWTDVHGRTHEGFVARPVSMHAMRGIAAHANGFHTCRALHVLQMLLGAIDAPGGHRFQPPYPKGTPPGNRPGKTRLDNGALDAAPLGYPHAPGDLLVDADGAPRRLDKAFSWQHPLAVHGMLQSVIRNAWAGAPYRIDTLFLFMANMSWNSAMNTRQTQAMLTDRDEATGEYRIPRIIYVDAYDSEMVAFADLVLPDTTYLERHDCISLFDRPISDADGAIDAIRQPVVAPDRDVRPFQDMLLDLGARLGLPGMVDADGAPKYPGGFPDYIVNHERAPGLGMLIGHRGVDGSAVGKGAPNPRQLDAYKADGCYFKAEVPHAGRYCRMGNADYLRWAASLGLVPATWAQAQGTPEPLVFQLYCETLQRFRLAGLGHGDTLPPPAERERVARYFDPLPFWYAPFEHVEAQTGDYPLAAITQRPMFMYHAWGSQNRWLRQIAARNVLYVHPDTAAAHGVGEGDHVRIESAHAALEAQIGLHGGVEPGTVWTWNAIGKQRGAWKLAKDAPEFRRGFLLNSLIPETRADGYANADPVTGQAAWFDLRVRLVPLKDQPRDDTFDTRPDLPAQAGTRSR
jgi:anaerobic selenocysteine-containing dehydrogenase